MKYCTKCVYTSASAVPLTFDKNGVCSGCRVEEQKKHINWEERAKMLKDLVEKYKDKSNYDCIIPVSGGKDSYYQTHYVTKVLGLKPLLVTYHANNYLPEAEENLNNMKKAFDVDHIIFRPSEKIIIKMNLLCFKMMGDMNWHAHCGIYTFPVQVAVKMKVPLLIWGEHGHTYLGGMYSMNDFIEMTAKDRLEHSQRGFDWFDMIGKEEGLREQDLLWAKYPTDKELEENKIRGIFLGNYVNWDPNQQVKIVKEKYGWQEARQPFERTYRMMSNLDDIHENGMHDYMKYIKFGYGRGSDHSCKDIRGGYMTRKQGIEMVRKYDHVKSSDLKRWCKYTGMNEEEFDAIADTFRDPRVWWKDKEGNWIKINIWDSPEENERKEKERIEYWEKHKQDLAQREIEREKVWISFKERIKNEGR
jgi:N-acetyl sugar amidotransferase